MSETASIAFEVGVGIVCNIALVAYMLGGMRSDLKNALERQRQADTELSDTRDRVAALEGWRNAQTGTTLAHRRHL